MMMVLVMLRKKKPAIKAALSQSSSILVCCSPPLCVFTATTILRRQAGSVTSQWQWPVTTWQMTGGLSLGRSRWSRRLCLCLPPLLTQVHTNWYTHSLCIQSSSRQTRENISVGRQSLRELLLKLLVLHLTRTCDRLFIEFGWPAVAAASACGASLHRAVAAHGDEHFERTRERERETPLDTLSSGFR